MISTNSTIQGASFTMDIYTDPYNQRIRIDDLRGNLVEAIAKAEDLAKDQQAEKLIVKGRKEQFAPLLEKGFLCEGMIDQYFLGSDAYFFCKYFSSERKRSEFDIKEDEIVKNVQLLERYIESISPPKEYELKLIQKGDAPKLALLYKEVFKVYPTPLHDPTYICKTIDEGTIYYAFTCGDKIVSAASAEVNNMYKNAELTDCATLPEHRKYGLMKILLEKLEQQLLEQGIYCSYSLARALSFGMNAALHQLGYDYRGRLINNCNIFDKIEDMNVWVKDLSTR